MQAILSRQRAETLSSVLYPDDRTYQGKELRLKQQHFFVSATIQVGSPWPALACSCLMSSRFGCFQSSSVFAVDSAPSAAQRRSTFQQQSCLEAKLGGLTRNGLFL